MTPDLARFLAPIARMLVAGLLCASASAPLLASDKLTLCYENKVVLPWRSTAQEGLNFALLKRVESKLDINFDYELLPWKRCLAKLKANEVDGAFSVSYSAARREFGVFPGDDEADARQRLHYARYFLVRKKGSQIDWDGKRFHHLDGKIAFQLGYSVGDLLHQLKVAVDETSDAPYSVGRKVVAGRVAGAAMIDSDVTALMRGPLAAELDVAATPLVEKPYFLMLSHALVKAKPELAARIWKSVEDVRNGREYGKLVQAAGVENAR